MVTISVADNESLLLQGEGPHNALRLSSFAEAAALHQQLGVWLAEQRGDGYLSTGEARAIAHAAGYELPFPTINSACLRGNIPGSRKQHGRWHLPKVAFEEWFQRWKGEQDLRRENKQ